MNYRVSLSLFICMLLQACMNVASTGVQALYYRHDINNSLQDYSITMHAYKTLQSQGRRFEDSRIVIVTLNKEVLLTGQVPAPWQKQEVEAMVRKQADTDHVYNLIQVSAPLSTLTQVSDTWITAKIKAQLMASNDMDATRIKVVTENGTVYLMGIVPPEAAREAFAIAENTDGVGKVVNMFTYMYMSKKYINNLT